MTAYPVRLPRLLSLLPKDGLNAVVYQSRWHALGLPTPANAPESESCRWEVKRVKLLFETTNDDKAPRVKANAYGVKYWKGECYSSQLGIVLSHLLTSTQQASA